jgi:hypothetical protein
MPDVLFEFGRSFAVDSGQDGVFDEGGFSLAGSALWPVSRLRTGLTLFADDLGDLTTELMDETVSPPQPLGTFHVAHVAVAGALWRMEVVGPRVMGLETFGRGDWGAVPVPGRRVRKPDRLRVEAGLEPGRRRDGPGEVGPLVRAHPELPPYVSRILPRLHERGGRVALATEPRPAPRRHEALTPGRTSTSWH